MERQQEFRDGVTDGEFRGASLSGLEPERGQGIPFHGTSMDGDLLCASTVT